MLSIVVVADVDDAAGADGVRPCRVISTHASIHPPQGGFTELISTAEKAWVAISKRSPPDVAAIERVKAAVSDYPHE